MLKDIKEKYLRFSLFAGNKHDNDILVTQHMHQCASLWSAPFPRWYYLAMDHQLGKGVPPPGYAHLLLHCLATHKVISACTIKFCDAYINDGQPRPARAAIITNMWMHSDYRMGKHSKVLILGLGKWLDAMNIKISVFSSPIASPLFADSD